MHFGGLPIGQHNNDLILILMLNFAALLTFVVIQ
jgi:hypothetical protein